MLVNYLNSCKMTDSVKQLEKKFYKLLSTDAAMQNFLNDEAFIGIWFWDLHHRKNIWLSQSINNLLGFEKDHHSKNPVSWNELLPKDYIDTICGSFDSYLDTDKVTEVELDIPFLQKNKRINFLKCRALAVNNKSYLLGLVQIPAKIEEFRITTICEFPFINNQGKLIGEISNKELSSERYADNFFVSKYDSLQIAGNLAGWEYKVDTGEIWCNKEYFDLLGYNMVSINRWEKFDIQKVWTDLIHPDDLELATIYFVRFLKDLNGLYSQSFRMKHANGSWVKISSTGKLMIEEIGGIKTLMVIGTNNAITEAKIVEEVIKSDISVLNENILLKSIINSPDDIFILSIDLEYRYTSFSESYKKYANEKFGQEIFIGYKILDLFSEFQISVFKPALDAALRGEHYEINTVIPLKSNKLTPVHLKYYPILNEDGKIKGATVFIHDITKENNIAIDNKINELGYENLFWVANEAIFIADAKTGSIVDANLKAIELLGYTKSEIISMQQTQIYPPELLEEIENKFKKFTCSNEIQSIEAFVLNKNGKRIPVQITASSKFKIGDETFSAVYIKDDSSRRLVREDLEKKNRQLKEIAWIQSHMIKTPLARLIGFSNALEKGIVSETDKPVYLKYIKESANELDCVIREIKSATLVN